MMHNATLIKIEEASTAAYNKAMAERVPQTVWASGGCDSWYFDKSGTPNLYPFPPQQYLDDMHRPDFAEFRLIEDVAEDRELQGAA